MIDGTLDLNTKTMDMGADGVATTHLTVGNMTGAGNLILDINFEDLSQLVNGQNYADKSDTISMTSATAASLNITGINIISPTGNITASKTLTIQYVSDAIPSSGLTTYVAKDSTTGASTRITKYTGLSEGTLSYSLTSDDQGKIFSTNVSGSGFRYDFTHADTGKLNVTISNYNTATIKDFFAGNEVVMDSIDENVPGVTIDFDEVHTYSYSVAGTTIYVDDVLTTKNVQDRLTVNLNSGKLIGDYAGTTTDPKKDGIEITTGKTVVLNSGILAGFDNAVNVANESATLNVNNIVFGDDASSKTNTVDIRNVGKVNFTGSANTVTKIANAKDIENTSDLTKITYVTGIEQDDGSVKYGKITNTSGKIQIT